MNRGHRGPKPHKTNHIAVKQGLIFYFIFYTYYAFLLLVSGDLVQPNQGQLQLVLSALNVAFFFQSSHVMRHIFMVHTPLLC